MGMWRLISKIILIFSYDIVSAKYFFNYTEVSWKEAQTVCNVPTIDDIMNKENKYSGLPTNLSAWTSSASVNNESDWTYFHGCLDVNQEKRNTKTTLNQYFRNSIEAINVNSVFECAYLCTTRADYFTFVKYICKCVYGNEIKLGLEENPVCMIRDSTQNIDAVYSMSPFALPIFKFKKEFRDNMIKRDHGKDCRYCCLASSYGNVTTYDCNTPLKYICAGNGLYLHGTWSDAINRCLWRNKIISNDRSISQQNWLKYFMYEKAESNQRCVTVYKKDVNHSLTYQYRNCSDLLPFLCNEENNSNSTESTFERSFKPTSADVSDVQISGGSLTNSKPYEEIVIVNVVLFGVCIIVILMIILRKRFNLHFCQKGSQHSRRITVKRNTVELTDRSSTGNDIVSPNNNEMRGSYTEPWELRHNIVHMDEFYQQDNIDVETEETET